MQTEQQLRVRADWSGLSPKNQHKSKWVVSCGIDGRSIGIVHYAGLHPQGHVTGTRHVFNLSEKEGVQYKLVLASTVVSNAGLRHSKQLGVVEVM